MWFPLSCVALLVPHTRARGVAAGGAAGERAGAGRDGRLDAADADLQRPGSEECLVTAFPESRSDFPALLNCLGLVREAVEVGVQAGVHASSFIKRWDGHHLRLIDKWSSQGDDSPSSLFYVDIANIHGMEVRQSHRAHCESRLADELHAGRVEIVNLDSTVAAAEIRDGELDFVYLDARHDFAGVVADIHAWWPKVRIGGIFAGHDFVDGEFPEGDFFWVSALREVLPGLEGHTHVTKEKHRYPSFFIWKTSATADVPLRRVPAQELARKWYAEKSKYHRLWDAAAPDARASAEGFVASCRGTCGQDCADRAREFTPTRTAGSTLRPFACGTTTGQPPVAPDSCAVETVIDAKSYHDVCIDRCNITCQQRSELFLKFGQEFVSV